MTLVQWLVLVVAVAVVAGCYWFLRSRADTDPWRNMDDPTADDDRAEAAAAERGEGLDGDSYIVAVRTLTEDHGSQTARAPAPGSPSDREADASWEAYKRSHAARDASAPAPQPGADPAPTGSGADDQAAPPSGGETQAGRAQPDPMDAPREPEPDASSEAARQAPPADAPGTEREPETESKSEPDAEPESQPAATPTARAHVEPQPKISDNQEIFILHVAAGEGRRFAGADVHAALAEQRLSFGLNDIYHRVADDEARPLSLYGVANMLNPGTLDPAAADELVTPGLTLFLIAPGAHPGRAIMREMMETANALAVTLGGQVLDDRRAVLNAQTAQHMLDRISELDRQAAVAHRRR